MCLKVFNGVFITDEWAYYVNGRWDDSVKSQDAQVEAFRFPKKSPNFIDLANEPENLKDLQISDIPAEVNKMFQDCLSGRAFA